jgi:hypothetical protein
MRVIQMRRLPKKSLPSVLLFEGPLRNADVGLGRNLAFLKGVHAFSIPPYNSGMTPEERYARIDARLERITMHLKLAASISQASGSRMEPADKRIDKLLATIEKDSEKIRELARIAEVRNPRRDDLEGDGRKN